MTLGNNVNEHNSYAKYRRHSEEQLQSAIQLSHIITIFIRRWDRTWQQNRTKKENNENKSFESIWQIGTKNRENQDIFNKQIVSSDIAYVYFKHFLKNKDLTVENNILILDDNYENFDEFKNESKELNSFNDLDKIKKLTLKEKLININETKINKKLNQNIETIRVEHTRRDLLNELGFQKLKFINSEFTHLNKLNYYTDNNSLKNNNSSDTLNESYDDSESNSSKSEVNNNYNFTKE